MSKSLSSPTTTPTSADTAFGDRGPVTAAFPTQPVSPWRAARWHVAAVMCSVAFLVLSYVLPTVTRVEVSFTQSTVPTRLASLPSVICAARCATDLFNVTLAGDDDGNHNYHELAPMIAAASPFKMTWCEVRNYSVAFRATSQQTPPQFAGLSFSVGCGDGPLTYGVASFQGTFHANAKAYAMIGGPWLLGRASFAELLDIAIDIAFFVILVTLVVQVFCLQINYTASQQSDTDIRLARGTLQRASRIAAILGFTGLLFVFLQFVSCNIAPIVYEDLQRDPDRTIVPQYYACLGAMAACVALSHLCMIVGYNKFPIA